MFLINTCMSKDFNKVKKIIINENGSIDEIYVEPIFLSLKEYNQLQITWIQKHKYFLSQKMKYDVGFNYSTNDWVKSGLAQYFRSLFKIKERISGP